MKTNNHSENPSGISKEEISSYLRGDLSPEEMYRLESILESDDFAYEAMEGLEESANPVQQMDDLAETYHTQYASPWYTQFHWKNIFYPIGGIMIIGAYFLLSSTTDAPINPIAVVQEKNAQTEQAIASTTPIEKTEIKPEITDRAELNTNKVVVETKNQSTKKGNSTKENKTTLAKPTITKTRNLPIASIKEIRYEKLIFDELKTPIITISRLDTPYEIFTIEGLDVVNLFYHNIFHNPDDLSEGLDPSIAHQDDYDPSIDKAENQKQYTYGNYIQSALEMYKSKKYTESIESLQIILEQYPKDVNAEFYIGLAYYRQNKSEKAIEYLDYAQNNGVAYFYDDAKLYKALSYKKKGDLKTCKKLLQEIIDQNGKNRKTAEEILNHQ